MKLFEMKPINECLGWKEGEILRAYNSALLSILVTYPTISTSVQCVDRADYAEYVNSVPRILLFRNQCLLQFYLSSDINPLTFSFEDTFLLFPELAIIEDLEKLDNNYIADKVMGSVLPSIPSSAPTTSGYVLQQNQLSLDDDSLQYMIEAMKGTLIKNTPLKIKKFTWQLSSKGLERFNEV